MEKKATKAEKDRIRGLIANGKVEWGNKALGKDINIKIKNPINHWLFSVILPMLYQVLIKIHGHMN